MASPVRVGVLAAELGVTPDAVMADVDGLLLERFPDPRQRAQHRAQVVMYRAGSAYLASHLAEAIRMARRRRSSSS